VPPIAYKVQRGKVTVTARSSIHDTKTVWTKLSGRISADPDELATATAEIAIDMKTFDAGDFMKNWKLKSELDPDKYPTATFRLARIDDPREPTAGEFTGVAIGQIGWRDKTVDIKARGSAKLDRRSLEAKASFELNVRDLGVAPPKILMFKVEDVVTVQVELYALPA
jgi:polyisoprenoid-binding protein YceI